MLNLRYSGGPGLRAKYCREHGVALTVEVLPSVLITKWDVLPAQVASHCYLVLDVLNGTDHEMELSYPEQRHMLMEPHESCRIPVTVRRCAPPAADEASRGAPQPMTARGASPDPMSSPRPGPLKLLEDACRKHLLDAVDIHWHLISLWLPVHCFRALLNVLSP